MVLAGREAARRRATQHSYGWSTVAEIAGIPEEHRDWAYELPRTQRETTYQKRQIGLIGNQPTTDAPRLARNRANPVENSM